jgi:3-hydroxyacyl-[acyl-carrier-protein] dehydratase
MSDPLDHALARLPHGREFRFLDRLLALEGGRHGVGEYRVRGDEPFLPGHFPGDPLMPGVLLIEAAAQLAGVVAQSDPALPPLRGLKLTAVHGARITGSACPGETLRIEAAVAGRLGGLVTADATVHVGARVVLTARLTLAGEP